MEKLILLSQKRDADAFTELMQQQMQTLYKVARSVLDSDADAADAVQDTILACWEKIGGLREPKYFKTWMTRILMNKCNDILRRKAAFWSVDQVPEIASGDPGYVNLEWKEVLRGLDEKYRLVMMLYYVEGFKTTEISQILEIPESTVRTRLARGRKQLAALYDPEKKLQKGAG